MTEQEQRITIASRHLGLRPIKGEKVSDCGHFTMLTADGNHLAFCPDYLNDLNAMHEVVMTLDRKTLAYSNYCSHLQQIVAIQNSKSNEPGIQAIDATAAQRAEAVGRALNLWKP